MDGLTRTEHLVNFINQAEQDARITTAHISLYTSLWKLWRDRGKEQLLCVFSREVMGVCKISSCSTYHKTIRQLHEFGYIYYIPSFNHFTGSVIEFRVLTKM